MCAAESRFAFSITRRCKTWADDPPVWAGTPGSSNLPGVTEYKSSSSLRQCTTDFVLARKSEKPVCVIPDVKAFDHVEHLLSPKGYVRKYRAEGLSLAGSA